jgi:hypothetical protein
VAVLAAACADPAGKYDDFVKRVPDAAAIVQIDATPLEEIPDITGTFLVGIAVPVAPDRPLQFLGTAVLDAPEGGDATVDLTLTPLDFETRIPVEGVDPLVGEDFAVSSGGEFNAEYAMYLIPGDANPITGQDQMVEPVTLFATIRSEDRFCGPLDGTLKPQNQMLTGATFSAIRVPDDATGDELPVVEAECPDETEADAGAGDAGAADAGAADAGAADASPADAAPGA